MFSTKTLCCMLLLPVLFACERKKQYLRIDYYSSYTFNNLPSLVEINNQPNTYEALIRKAMAYTGIKDSSVVIVTTDQFGAFFAINKSNLQRLFLYSPAFFDSVLKATKSQNALFSICFHELAHMFYNHPLKPTRFSRIYELQADHYSGYESKLIQAGIGEATKTISIFGNWTETESHPAKAVRMDEIESGYLEACELIPPHCSDSLMRIAAKKRIQNYSIALGEANKDAAAFRINKQINFDKTFEYDVADSSVIPFRRQYNLLAGKYSLYGDTLIVDTKNKVHLLHTKEQVASIETDKQGTNVLNIDGVKFYLENEILYSITPAGAILNAGYKID